MKTISINDYGKLIGFDFEENENPTLQQVQDFAENELDETIWDYPLEEWDYLLENPNENGYVFVNNGTNIRICELINKL